MIEAGLVSTTLAALGLGGLLYRDSTGRPIWERPDGLALPYLGLTVVWHWVASIGSRRWPVFGTEPAAKRRRSAHARVSALLPGDGGADQRLDLWADFPGGLCRRPGGATLGVMISVGARAEPVLITTHRPPGFCLAGPALGARDAGRPGLGEFLLFLTFVLVTSHSRALRHSATEVHADGPPWPWRPWRSQ